MISIFCQAQDAAGVDKILLGNKQVPKVLLVGTFHFGYPGLDTHKTSDEHKIDINSPQRQKEVEALVEYIAKFKPTKIMVETGPNTGYLMERYRTWKEEKGMLKKREVDQIGFRLMDRFGLDTLYGVDSYSMSSSLSRSQDSIHAKPILDRIYSEKPDSLFESEIGDNYWKWYELMDARCVEMNLLDYFKECNSDHHINRMHGHYLLKDLDDSYDGIDGLTINWFSRNLRIIKNIHMIDTSPDDRIMIMFGSGHIPILKQQLECTPEYELVRFGDLE